MQYNSFHRYEGLFNNGKFNGKGIFFYGSLDKYEGDFIDGRWESHQWQLSAGSRGTASWAIGTDTSLMGSSKTGGNMEWERWHTGMATSTLECGMDIEEPERSPTPMDLLMRFHPNSCHQCAGRVSERPKGWWRHLQIAQRKHIHWDI